MNEDNIEVGICDVNGFRRLDPSEVKDYLAAIAQPEEATKLHLTFAVAGKAQGAWISLVNERPEQCSTL